MSQFCRNCGTEIPDNASFCPNCGTQAVQNANAQPQSPTTQAFRQGRQPGTGIKNKTVGLLAGIGALVLVAVIIIALAGGGGSGYKSAVNAFFKAMESGKTERVIACLPPLLRYDFEYYTYKDMDDFIKSIKSIKYKITYTKRLDKDEIEDLEYIYRYYDMKVDDAYLVRVDTKLRLNLSKLDRDLREYYEYMGNEIDDSFEMIALKTKGKWYVLSENF